MKSCLQLFRRDPYTPYDCRLKVYLISVLINLQLEIQAQSPELVLDPANRCRLLALVDSCVRDAVKQFQKIFEVRQNIENREVLSEVFKAIRSFFNRVVARIREKGDIVDGLAAACGR